jgi:polyisoprenoid-binding protein YceI
MQANFASYFRLNNLNDTIMAKSTWALDPTHSEVGFKVKHMMFTNVSGKFNNYDVTVSNEDDDFSTSNIEFSADINSIDTNNVDRDNHLKSADFFDGDNFPKMTFKSTSVEKKSDNDFSISGDLTIKNITKAVTLNAEYSGLMKDPWGNTKAGLSIETKINRKDFGLTWNAALETGGVLVGEDVRIIAEVQIVKQ